MQRVIVFIDGPNLYWGVKKTFGYEWLDVVILAKKLCTISRDLVETRYYDSPFVREINEKRAREQQKYLEKLKSAGVAVVTGKYTKQPVRIPPATYEKLKPCLKTGLFDEYKEPIYEKIEGYIEKGTDVALAVDMVRLAYEDKYDCAILVSGDGDFVRAINVVKEILGKSKKRKRIQAASLENDERKCYDVKASADSFIKLDYIIPPVIKQQKAAGNTP